MQCRQHEEGERAQDPFGSDPVLLLHSEIGLLSGGERSLEIRFQRPIQISAGDFRVWTRGGRYYGLPSTIPVGGETDLIVMKTYLDPILT